MHKTSFLHHQGGRWADPTTRRALTNEEVRRVRMATDPPGTMTSFLHRVAADVAPVARDLMARKFGKRYYAWETKENREDSEYEIHHTRTYPFRGYFITVTVTAGEYEPPPALHVAIDVEVFKDEAEYKAQNTVSASGNVVIAPLGQPSVHARASEPQSGRLAKLTLNTIVQTVAPGAARAVVHTG